MGVKSLRLGKSEPSDSGASDAPVEVPDADGADSSDTVGTDTAATPTPGKGRPTPKRREVEARKRGPVAPAPMTSKEARARKRSNKGTKEERRKESAERRAEANRRRERMLAGDEKYLLPRDRGPARRYVRDLVDSRRHLMGMFMPTALVLMVGTLFAPPQVAALVTLAMLAMVAVLVIEGIFLGRRVNAAVRERFPKEEGTGFRLGWYAFVRASQLRRMRAPKPQVSPGDAV